MRRTFAAFLALGLLIAGTAPVRADSVYRTERLTLDPVGGASGTGMVVNVHPNGPNRYAIETYQLRGAEANATYEVSLNLYLGAADCEEDPAASMTTAQIQTNAAGNGTAQLVITPETIVAFGLSGSFPINWTVTQGGTLTHQTGCTTVTLD